MNSWQIRLQHFLSKPRNILLLYVGVVIFVFGFLVIGFFIITRDTPLQQDNGLSKDEESKILGKIAENNAQNLFNKPSDLPSNNPKSITQPINVETPVSPTPQPSQPDPVQPQPGNVPLPDPKVVPDLTKYNYRKTVTNVAYGPSAEKCVGGYGGDGGGPGFFAGNTVAQTESVEYFTETSAQYKYVYSDSDKDLVSYQLTEYSNSVNQAYVYMNGSYAALNKYKPDPSYSNYAGNSQVISYPQGNAEDLIHKFFGVNAKVLGKVSENGKDYYVIQNSYNTYCSPNPFLIIPGVEPDQEQKMLEIYKVDSNSFNIVKIDRYLNSISSTNLIASTSINTELKLISPTDVGTTFTFNLTGNIKVVDYTNYSYNIDKSFHEMIDYLKTSDLNFLFPNRNARLTNIYSTALNKKSIPENGDYISKRDFFAPGIKGDTLFNRYNNANNYSVPDVSLYFTENSDIYYSEYIYDDVSIDKLTNDLTFYPATSTSLTDEPISINGEDITVKKIVRRFDYKYPIHVSYPSYPTSFPVNISSSTGINYLFVYNNKLYNLSYSIDSIKLDKLPAKIEYTSYFTGDDSDFQYLTEQVKSAFYYYVYPASYPSSYTIYPVSYTSN